MNHCHLTQQVDRHCHPVPKYARMIFSLGFSSGERNRWRVLLVLESGIEYECNKGEKCTNQYLIFRCTYDIPTCLAKKKKEDPQ